MWTNYQRIHINSQMHKLVLFMKRTKTKQKCTENGQKHWTNNWMAFPWNKRFPIENSLKSLCICELIEFGLVLIDFCKFIKIKQTKTTNRNSKSNWNSHLNINVGKIT